MSITTLKHLTCATCKEEKPVTHFNQRASSKTGYAPHCRTCTNKKRRAKKSAPAGTTTQLKTLIKKGDVNSIKKALKKPSQSLLNALLKTCVTPYVSYPKTDAHAQLVHHIVQKGANPNSQNEQLLSLAAQTGRPDLVDALIKEGATITFFSAAAILDLTKIKKALKKDPSLAKATDNNGLTALHHCAGSALGQASKTLQKKQLNLITLLLESGADPNHEADVGIPTTPLVSCCQSGGVVPVIEALVHGGADPNHPHALRSALRHFKQKRSPENPVADALIQCGCKVDGPISSDRTCLHLYSHHEEIQAVTWLLNNGASVQAKTPDERTPLHLAAERNNNTTIVKLLLDHGANINAIDILGNKPIDYAQNNNKTKIVQFLSTL